MLKVVTPTANVKYQGLDAWSLRTHPLSQVVLTASKFDLTLGHRQYRLR